MPFDVIVIGGSYAGMAAALQLLRARRSVLVIDAGQRRNRFATQSHGFLSRDGEAAVDIARIAGEQLAAYPTLSWVEDHVESVAGERDAFTTTTRSDEVFEGRRLLFATGVRDELPAIEGLAERWGSAVNHCPYCHGYELGQGRIGVIANSQMSSHQAELLTEWGAVTYFPNGFEVDSATREKLSARGVTIEPTRIARLDRAADVVLTDGRELSFAGLFTAPITAPASSMAERFGCQMLTDPMGTRIRTTEDKQCTIPGAYACGDVARAPHSVTLAVADGAWAGMNIHRSLVWPGV